MSYIETSTFSLDPEPGWNVEDVLQMLRNCNCWREAEFVDGQATGREKVLTATGDKVQLVAWYISIKSDYDFKLE